MNRIDQLKSHLNLEQNQSFLIFNQYNITYLSSFNGHAATILLTKTTNYLITDYRYFEQAKTQATNFKVICRDRPKQGLNHLINQILRDESIKVAYFESEHINFSNYQNLSQELNNIDLIAKSRLVEELRFLKDSDEIDSLQKAAKIADLALENMLNHVKENVTERELANELDYQMAKLGSEELSFATILVFAERSALPHGIPGNKKLKNGDLILIDFGAVVNGYHSDMTRTYVFGKANSQQKQIHQLVFKAQKAAMDAIEHGVTGEFLYQQSERILQASPYAKFMGEGLGHGVGLELHEQPFMGKNCQLKIKQGCVITIEPGIYIPDWGGVRIEDDIAVTKDGIKILNTAPNQLLELLL
jgi:Xaa-Pro aminopeptidase/Xaa-Pro dipeptidase